MTFHRWKLRQGRQAHTPRFASLSPHPFNLINGRCYNGSVKNEANQIPPKEKSPKALREDLIDLQAVHERRNEPGRSCEQFVADLKRDRLL